MARKHHKPEEIVAKLRAAPYATAKQTSWGTGALDAIMKRLPPMRHGDFEENLVPNHEETQDHQAPALS
jgi:hypothetical protein